VTVKEFGLRLLSAPYELIFKEKMDEQARTFVLSTSYVGVATLVGGLFTLAFSIIAARALGPSDFGVLGLVTTVGTILGISMLAASTPMIKYGAEAQDHFVQVSIFSTSYILVALLIAASICIYALFSAPLSYAFGVPADVFFFALVLGVTSTAYQFTTNSLRGLFKMRAYALLTAAQSVLLLAAFFTFIGTDMKSWESASYSYFLSYAVVGFILVIYLRDYIKLRFDRSWAKKIVHYAVLALPGGVAASFMGIDRILINKFMTTADVGIYNAYFLPSITVAVMLWMIINAAFFPYASRSSDKLAILRRTSKAAPYFAAVLAPSLLILQWIIFFLYGRQYPFSWGLGFIFAIAGITAFFYQALSWLMASEGTRGAAVNTLSSFISLIVLVCFDVVLIPLIGLLGAAITLIFAYVTATLYLLARRRVLGAKQA